MHWLPVPLPGRRDCAPRSRRPGTTAADGVGAAGGDVVLHVGEALAVPHLDVDRPDRMRLHPIAAAEALPRGEWDQERVVLVVSEGRLTLLRHRPDDEERHVADSDGLPHGIDIGE